MHYAISALASVQDAEAVDHGTDAKPRGGGFMNAINNNRVVKALTFVRTQPRKSYMSEVCWQFLRRRVLSQGFPYGPML